MSELEPSDFVELLLESDTGLLVGEEVTTQASRDFIRKLDNDESTNSLDDISFHEFSFNWCFWQDSSTKPGESIDANSFIESQMELGNIHSVATFCNEWNNLSRSDKNVFGVYSNLRLFKKGIRPLWEDPSNKNGGKWVIRVKVNLEGSGDTISDQSSRMFLKLLIHMVTGQLSYEDDLCGAGITIKPETLSLSLWNKDALNNEQIGYVTERLYEVLIPDKVEYWAHANNKTVSRRTEMSQNSTDDGFLPVRKPRAPRGGGPGRTGINDGGVGGRMGGNNNNNNNRGGRQPQRGRGGRAGTHNQSNRTPGPGNNRTGSYQNSNNTPDRVNNQGGRDQRSGNRKNEQKTQSDNQPIRSGPENNRNNPTNKQPNNPPQKKVQIPALESDEPNITEREIEVNTSESTRHNPNTSLVDFMKNSVSGKFNWYEEDDNNLPNEDMIMSTLMDHYQPTIDYTAIIENPSLLQSIQPDIPTPLPTNTTTSATNTTTPATNNNNPETTSETKTKKKRTRRKKNKDKVAPVEAPTDSNLPALIPQTNNVPSVNESKYQQDQIENQPTNNINLKSSISESTPVDHLTLPQENNRALNISTDQISPPNSSTNARKKPNKRKSPNNLQQKNNNNPNPSPSPNQNLKLHINTSDNPKQPSKNSPRLDNSYKAKNSPRLNPDNSFKPKTSPRNKMIPKKKQGNNPYGNKTPPIGSPATMKRQLPHRSSVIPPPTEERILSKIVQRAMKNIESKTNEERRKILNSLKNKISQKQSRSTNSSSSESLDRSNLTSSLNDLPVDELQVLYSHFQNSYPEEWFSTIDEFNTVNTFNEGALFDSGVDIPSLSNSQSLESSMNTEEPEPLIETETKLDDLVESPFPESENEPEADFAKSDPPSEREIEEPSADTTDQIKPDPETPESDPEPLPESDSEPEPEVKKNSKQQKKTANPKVKEVDTQTKNTKKAPEKNTKTNKSTPTKPQQPHNNKVTNRKNNKTNKKNQPKNEEKTITQTLPMESKLLYIKGWALFISFITIIVIYNYL